MTEASVVRLGEGSIGRGEATAALMRFFVTARLVRGEPVVGIRRGDVLAAVALVSDPRGGAACTSTSSGSGPTAAVEDSCGACSTMCTPWLRRSRTAVASP